MSRIGVDVGGTFTDLVVLDDGKLEIMKVSTTPRAPEKGVVKALDEVDEYEKVNFFGHGTTVATNAVLERDWSETAFITTEGFRDVLEIGRQDRPEIYGLENEKPEPVVPRRRRYEVSERVDESGEVVKPLDKDEVRRLVNRMDGSVDSVAVSFLFSFREPGHERMVQKILEDELGVSVSISSEVMPEIREYERSLATALNASLRPVIDDYLSELENSIENFGIETDLNVIQSNGGLATSDTVRRKPINTLLSGPAAGVMGASYVAGLCDENDIITMDMGGTSCDVALVEDGDPLVSTDVEVGDYTVGVPMIDIHTIGSGGGSIAGIDDGGALRVGPESAGAEPGPVCYGRGGEKPTVTDAHFLLGRIDPSSFDSDFGASVSDVEEAFRGIVDALSSSTREAARGVLNVADASMERALRLVSVERGYDPREFSLVGFGGAGPLHAPRIAERLDIPKVIIPPTAGVLSALGILSTDIVYDYSRTVVENWREISARYLKEVYGDFETDAREKFESPHLEHYLDLRYEGQSFEITVEVADFDDLGDAESRFHDEHERLYGHAYPDEPLELVNIRMKAKVETEEPELMLGTREGEVEDAVTETREVVYDGDALETRVYQRELLPLETGFEGPAVVESSSSTLVVEPDQSAEVDSYGNIILHTRGGSDV